MKKIALCFLVITFSFSAYAFKKRLKEKHFKKVEHGMLKTEVLKYVGSPRVSRRWKGKDRWIYKIQRKEGRVVLEDTKEIHFEGGKVVYIGEPIAPKVSAEEQDELNLQAAKADLKAWENRQEAAKKSREDYQKWVLKVKGKSKDKGVTVPRFRPVN